jgi:hypothetical protein
MKFFIWEMIGFIVAAAAYDSYFDGMVDFIFL